MPENPPIHAILNAVTDEKPKIFQSGRDIIYSLAAILAVMIASVAFTGMCSYGRNTPQNMPVVKVDAATFFNLEARASNFPIRLPQVPDDWTPNSARRGAVAGKPAPIVGWVIGNNGYAQLTQTDVPVEQAVENLDEHVREQTATYDLAGHTVMVYTGTDRDTRAVRVVDLGDVRLIVTGAATDDQFNDLLIRTIAADSIPVER